MHLCPECELPCFCDCTKDPYDSFEECTHYLRDDCIPIERDSELRIVGSEGYELGGEGGYE